MLQRCECIVDVTSIDVNHHGAVLYMKYCHVPAHMELYTKYCHIAVRMELYTEYGHVSAWMELYVEYCHELAWRRRKTSCRACRTSPGRCLTWSSSTAARTCTVFDHYEASLNGCALRRAGPTVTRWCSCGLRDR